MATLIEVWLVLPNLDAGGAERVLIQVANHLDKSRFKPVMVLMQKQGVLLAQLNPSIEIIELKIYQIRFLPFAMAYRLRNRKPHIIMAGWGEIGAYFAWMKPFYKNIKWISRETNMVSKHVTSPIIRFLYKRYVALDAIVAQSDDMVSDLQVHLQIPDRKIIKINNPVDLNALSQTANQQNIFLNKGVKNILAVGNLTYRKGFDRLLDVLQYLKNKPIVLHIVGDGPDKEQLLSKVKILTIQNQVVIHGKQNNIADYYQHADLFVLSSRYEGFPNVLLEAGAFGLFSVCNDALGGIREIIRTQTGTVHDINDLKGFSKCIEQALEKHHSKNTIQNLTLSRFGQSKIIRQFESFFEYVLRV